jgi:hypothetical protein
MILFLGWGETESTWNRQPLFDQLYQPRMMDDGKQSVEWLAGDSKLLGENLPQCRFVHHKSHMIWPGLEPGPPQWEAND